MTAAGIPYLDAGQLGVERVIDDKGGQGVVRRVSAPGWPGSGMAVKEYRPEVEVDWAVLEQMVRFGVEAGEVTRRWLSEHTAWPLAIVTRDGVSCGFLMRLAPDECYGWLRLPTPRTLLTFEFLLNTQEYAQRINLVMTLAQRLSVLRELVLALDHLHRLGIAVGDLSPKNVVFGVVPHPRCFFLDCDSMSMSGEAVLRPVETPGWEAPVGERPTTIDSDVYKVGLFAVRLVAGDQMVTRVSDVYGYPVALVDVTDRSLGTASARPRLAEWVPALDAAIRDASDAPAWQPHPVAPPVTLPQPAGAPTHPAGPRTTPPGPGAGMFPSTPKRSRRRLAVPIITMVLLFLSYVLITIANRASPGSPAYTAPATTAPPTVVGVVTIAEVATDPRAVGVGRLFDQYFSGINNHNFGQVLTSFDPNSDVGRASSSGRDQFARNVSTSTDTDIQVTGLGPSDGTGALTATLTFRSAQAAGYGPASNPDETCTVWTVTYTLTEPSRDTYLILKGKGSSIPC
jgi:hypothetical protein